MGNSAIGNQTIGWKFKTLLEGKPLTEIMSEITTPGLLSRPKFTPTDTASVEGQPWTVGPFVMAIQPSDLQTERESADIDENGNQFIRYLTKISTASPVDIFVKPSDIAIGFSYTFAPLSGDGSALSPQENWYGDIVILTSDNIRDFKGIIIGTVQHYVDVVEGESKHYYSITSSGADISDALLEKEGWDPRSWLSVIHPKRAIQDGDVKYNKLELRCHNHQIGVGDTVGVSEPQFITGAYGVKQLNATNTVYTFKTDDETNPQGIRGFMPANYNGFSIQSGTSDDTTGLMPKTWEEGVTPIDCSDTLPITKQSGNIIALVDATNVNIGDSTTSFVNRLKIYPVKQQKYNVYLDNQVLYIK